MASLNGGEFFRDSNVEDPFAGDPFRIRRGALNFPARTAMPNFVTRLDNMGVDYVVQI